MDYAIVGRHNRYCNGKLHTCRMHTCVCMCLCVCAYFLRYVYRRILLRGRLLLYGIMAYKIPGDTRKRHRKYHFSLFYNVYMRYCPSTLLKVLKKNRTSMQFPEIPKLFMCINVYRQ